MIVGATSMTITCEPPVPARTDPGNGSRSAAPTVRVEALGALSVLVNRVDRDIGKPQARMVLAFLLIHLGQVVPTDLIVDELWGDEPPASAHHALHVAISTLRRVLETGREHGEPYRRLITNPPGYLLYLDDREFDVSAAEQLIVRGRHRLQRSDLMSSESCLIAAEQLWKGQPYADFMYADFAQPEIRRLTELRLGVIEDRVEVQLLLGKHHELVPELEYLALEHPSRERFTHQLMTALIRSDRRGDALRVYGEASRRLWVQFGVTPGHALADLAREIRDPTTTYASAAR